MWLLCQNEGPDSDYHMYYTVCCCFHMTLKFVLAVAPMQCVPAVCPAQCEALCMCIKGSSS